MDRNGSQACPVAGVDADFHPCDDAGVGNQCNYEDAGNCDKDFGGKVVMGTVEVKNGEDS